MLPSRWLAGDPASGPWPQLPTTTAIGGITAAMMLITTAAEVDQKRTTFQASRISTRQVPISTKYQRLRSIGCSPPEVGVRLQSRFAG